MFRPRRLRLSALLRGLRGGRGCAPLPSRTERELRPAWVSASGGGSSGDPSSLVKTFPSFRSFPLLLLLARSRFHHFAEWRNRRERRGGDFCGKGGGGGRRRAYRSESDVPMISRRDVVDSGEFFLIHPMPRAVQRRGFKRLVSVRIPR